MISKIYPDLLPQETVWNFKYNSGILIEKTKYLGSRSKKVYLYDENQNCISITEYFDEKVANKHMYLYKNDFLSEEIIYDEFNEPIVKYVFELQ